MWCMNNHIQMVTHTHTRSVYDTEVAPQALQYVRCVPAAFLRLVLAGAGAIGSAASAATVRVRAAAASTATGHANASGPADVRMQGSAPSAPVGGDNNNATGVNAQTGHSESQHRDMSAVLCQITQLPSTDLRGCMGRADTDVRLQQAMQVGLCLCLFVLTVLVSPCVCLCALVCYTACTLKTYSHTHTCQHAPADTDKPFACRSGTCG